MYLDKAAYEDLTRAISNLLLCALESCRQGDYGLATKLGLQLETLQNLDSLKADQVLRLASIYMKGMAILEVMKLDSTRIAKIIDLEVEQATVQQMQDQFLARGACKTMMNDLFGMRSTAVANRKRFLNIETIKGRNRISTEIEQRHIFDAWIESIEVADVRERLLYVAGATSLPLSAIYRETNEIEQIRNSVHSNKTICA